MPQVAPSWLTVDSAPSPQLAGHWAPPPPLIAQAR